MRNPILRRIRQALGFALLGAVLGHLAGQYAALPYSAELGALLLGGWGLFDAFRCQLTGHAPPDATVTAYQTAEEVVWQCPVCREMTSIATPRT